MNRKYFAYLHKHHHLMLKLWTNEDRFMEIVKDGLNEDSMVKAVFMPFTIDIPLSDWEIKLQKEGIISCAEIPPKPFIQSPALLHIKNLIEKINWNKG